MSHAITTRLGSLRRRRFAVWALGILILGTAGAARAQTYSTIDVPGSTATAAFGINAQRDIVGRWDDADFNTHGFLLRHGHFTTVDFPGAIFTAPRDINTLGHVVGRYVDA